MSHITGWRLVSLCLLFYLFACLFSGIMITLTGESALPVRVGMTGFAKKNLIDIDVYRISINGGQRPLTVKEYAGSNKLFVKDALSKSYFQAIQIKISNQQVNSLTSIVVEIGNKAFTFSRQEFLNNWKLIRQSPQYRLYESPDSISAPRSFLPFWGKVINSGQNLHMVWDIFLHKIPVLILILAFLGLLTRSGQRLTDYIKSRAICRGNWPLWVSVGLAAFITLYRMPYDVQPITAGLDPSWILGLNWAYTKGLGWGQDLAFTYGPYYWLLYPNLALTSPVLLISLIVTTVVFSYAIGVFIYYIIRQVQDQKISILVAVLAIVSLAFFEYTLNDIVVVATILLLAIDGLRSYVAAILPACILLALLSLCKFSYLAVSLCTILFFCGQCLFKRKYAYFFLSILTFIGALCILWLINDQYMNNLWLFISRAYEVAQGYSEAMATPIWNESQSVSSNIITNVLLLLVGLLFILGVVILFLTSLRKNGIWFQLLYTAPILFLAFKEGFIRLDFPHAVIFFAQFQIIIIAYVIFYSKQERLSSFTRIILVGSFISLLLVTDAHVQSAYKPELAGVFSPDTRAELLSASRHYLQKAYPLDHNIQKSIGNSLIDIIPYDIALLYGYGFNWNPRLVFQSYSVYSNVLDSLNASHLRNQRPPDKLLFSFKSIDSRYPLFEEPALIRSLIDRYSVEESSMNTYLLLHRKINQPTTLFRSARLSPTMSRSMNTDISIPTRPGYYTYLNAKVELTLLGKLLNFLLKIQPLFIDVNLKGNTQVQRFRLIRQTTQDGLLVSSFAENFKMASKILSGDGEPNVVSIKFIGNTWLYCSDITASFRFEACSHLYTPTSIVEANQQNAVNQIFKK